MGKQKLDKPTPEERRALRPPSGVKIDPPDDINENSIFNSAAPTLSEVDHMPQNSLSTVMESVDVSHLEKRITLIARLVIEDALWNKDGLTRKERADIAFNAIRVLEGTKSTLWVQDPNEKNIPKTTEAMQKEKDRIEDRLIRLMKSKKRLVAAGSKAASDAIEFVEMEKNAT